MKNLSLSLKWGVGVVFFAVAAVLGASFERGISRAQDFGNFGDSGALGGGFGAPFSLDGSGSGDAAAGFFVPGGAAEKSAPLTVDAKFSRGTDAAFADEFWRENDASGAAKGEIVGILTIKTKVADGWHIYSPTQGAGGTPTTFAISVDGGAFEIGAVRLATPFKTVEFFGDSLEELTGDVDWIAPIRRVAAGENSGENADAAPLSELKITGTVDALACSEGDGAACVPQKVEFLAKFDDANDPTAILDAAKKFAETTQTTQVAQISENAQDAEASETAQVETAGDGGASGTTQFASRNWFVLLISAFLGGLILNVTPCVLPVIGLKILSFFENAGRSRAKAFMLNIWYSVGVAIVFGALAFASVGLSFLFTRALFQILMSAIVFAMALSLIGVWELQTPAFLGGQKSNELTAKEGPVGAIFKGIITTLLAIPCGAPLLSPVLDWASETTRQGEIGLVVVVYLVIGLGMASPFLLAGAFPELLKFFPKPGAWMETFRKTMGFFLLGAVVWILYSAPLEFQLPTTAFLFALWFACWNVGRNQFEFDAGKKKAVGWAVSAAVVLVVGVFAFNFPGNPNDFTLQSASENKLTRWGIRAQRDGRLTQEHWKLFDRATLDAELAKGRPVVVDFTADWCMNCKFLERTILHTPEATAVFDAKNAVTLTADWTNQNGDSPDILEINELLDANGARQVPTLMIFSPKNPEKPIVLRGLYTKAALFEAMESVGAAE